VFRYNLNLNILFWSSGTGGRAWGGSVYWYSCCWL